MSLFSLLKGQIGRIIEYNDNHPDFPMDEKRTEAFMSKSLVWAVAWSFGGYERRR
jgi:dynein heavy chain 1